MSALRVERLILPGGWRVLIRPIELDDRETMRRGFEHLSAEARYFRFFCARGPLSESELRYLCDVDQEDHLALVALADPPFDPPEGLGVVRALRLGNEPDCFETAVTVVDYAQGRGLGEALIRRIAAAVAERGGERLRFSVLPGNAPMRRLLHRLAPSSAAIHLGGVLSFDVRPAELAAPAEGWKTGANPA